MIEKKRGEGFLFNVEEIISWVYLVADERQYFKDNLSVKGLLLSTAFRSCQIIKKKKGQSHFSWLWVHVLVSRFLDSSKGLMHTAGLFFV